MELEEFKLWVREMCDIENEKFMRTVMVSQKSTI